MTPIEDLFMSAATKSGQRVFHVHGAVYLDVETAALDKHGPKAIMANSFIVGSQTRVWRRVVDFVVATRLPRGTTVKCFVECDGHDFHERTKEQARRDRARDRHLQALAPVLRFTGQELWEDSEKCWQETVECLIDVHNDEVSARNSGKKEALADLLSRADVSDKAHAIALNAIYGFKDRFTNDEVDRIGAGVVRELMSLRHILRFVRARDGSHRVLPIVTMEEVFS